jgi:hypothetical protein
MVEVHQHSAECVVFTFKEGLLSSVAHDLKLTVGRWSLKLVKGEGVRLEGSWDPSTLTVAAVMRDGHEASNVLGARDMDKIAKTIREDVLHSDKHREIRFEGQASVESELAKIEGRLTLAGRTQAVKLTARRTNDKWVAEVPIHQPDFGIKPYSAMLGALKIKPDVKVRVTVPVSALGGEV